MRHIYKSSAFALIFTLCLMAFNSLSVKAETVDLGELLPDETYQFPEYKTVIAHYTPTVTGPVKFLWSASPLTLYSSAAHGESDIVEGSHSYTAGGQLISYQKLEAGHTYYIFANMTIMATTLVIREGDTKIELVDSSPSVNPESPYYYNGKFSASRSYRIDLDFNYPVTVGNCFLIANGERSQLAPVVSNATVSFDVNDVVMNFYHQGHLKDGDTMTLRVLQIKDATNPDNKLGENGRLEIDFTVDAKPAELVETRGFSQKLTDNPFYSYYFSGDEASKMQLVFDRDIDPEAKPLAQVTYGNPDNIDLGLYNERVEGVIDGSVVSFDFSGKLRRRIDMLPGADPTQLPYALFVSYTGVTTPDGQRAYTGMISNPTGFSTSYTINELQYSIAADFTPARGTALKPGQEMEIWVMNGSKIRYDNICIDYIENGEPKTIAVDNDKVAVTVDSFSANGDDMLYNFTLPEFTADAGTEMSVYMKGLVCADGLDHANDVRGEYISGESGVDGIGADDSATVADVFDITGKCVLRSATRSRISTLDKGIYIFNGKKIVVR